MVESFPKDFDITSSRRSWNADRTNLFLELQPFLRRVEFWYDDSLCIVSFQNVENEIADINECQIFIPQWFISNSVSLKCVRAWPATHIDKPIPSRSASSRNPEHIAGSGCLLTDKTNYAPFIDNYYKLNSCAMNYGIKIIYLTIVSRLTYRLTYSICRTKSTRLQLYRLGANDRRWWKWWSGGWAIKHESRRYSSSSDGKVWRVGRDY